MVRGIDPRALWKHTDNVMILVDEDVRVGWVLGWFIESNDVGK